MKKRMLISGLWFVSMWGIGGALHVFFDVPRALMLVPAITVAVAWWIGLSRYEASLKGGPVPTSSTNRYSPESALRTPVLEA